MYSATLTDDGRRRDREGELPALEHPGQAAVVGVQHSVEGAFGRPVEPPAALFRLAAQQMRAHHRRRRQRHQHRDRDRHRQRHREFAKQPADQPSHQEDRNEHRNQRCAHRDDREADLFCADERGGERRQTVGQVTVDVLDDDDRVVHHESGGDGQRHEREIVQAVSEEVHRAERAEQREGNGDAGDDRRPGTPQEDEDDEDDQDDCQTERPLDVGDRRPNRGRPIDGGIEIDRGRQQRPELRQQGLDPIDGVDDVRAGLAEHLELHGRFAVGQTGDANVLHRVLNGSEVGEAYRRAIAVGHDQRFVVGRLEQLIGGADLEGRGRVRDLALGPVGVGHVEDASDLIEPEVVLRQRTGIQLDPHGR